MFRHLEQLRRLAETPLGWLDLAAIAVIGACVIVVFVAILVDFAENRARRVKQERKSVVETGTMTLFFLGYYAIIRLRIGALEGGGVVLRAACLAAGLVVIVAGCAVNVAGRFRLGRNWANQVTVYEDQSLVTGGVYRWVRHPLYASLIWMFYGASLAYLNGAAFLANSLVFVPFMYYRARQEEAFLAREFRDYGEYRKTTGMFFPKWRT